MFKEQLKMKNQFKTIISLSEESSLPLEVQYQVCGLFLRLTGQQIAIKESQVILNSEILLKKLSLREEPSGSSTAIESESEVSSGRMGVGMEELQSMSPRGQARKVEHQLRGWLQEVQENCSAICLNQLKTLATDYQRLLQRRWELEARENIIARKYSCLSRMEEENLMQRLKKRVEVEEDRAVALSREIEGLKEKHKRVLEYANSKLREVVGEHRMAELNAKVGRELKTFLQERQRIVASRIRRAQEIQGGVMRQLQSFLLPQACQTCCSMLRKLKDSLLRFRWSLDSEANQMQQIFNKHKKSLFATKPQSTKYF